MTTNGPSVVIPAPDRYAVLRRISTWQHERLRAATVLVAGAGALGNEILKNLALLGVGHIVLVDFDHIELPNLSRSVLFRESNRGQSKAKVAAEAVRAINPDVAVSVINGDVAYAVGLGVFRRTDVILGGLDNRQARLALNGHAWRTGKPWVDGALAETAGAVRIFVPPEGSCYECTLSIADYQQMSLRTSCHGIAIKQAEEGKIATTPTVASIIGAMQVQEALKLLHGQPVLAGHELLYDANVHSLQIVKLPCRQNCLGHSTLGHVTEVGEFRAGKSTAAELLVRAQTDLGREARLQLDHEVLIGRKCRHGHENPPIFCPSFRLQATEMACRVCHEEITFDMAHFIDEHSPHLDATLADWGLPPGHIVRARLGRQPAYYELTGDISQILPWIKTT